MRNFFHIFLLSIQVFSVVKKENFKVFLLVNEFVLFFWNEFVEHLNDCANQFFDGWNILRNTVAQESVRVFSEALRVSLSLVVVAGQLWIRVKVVVQAVFCFVNEPLKVLFRVNYEFSLKNQKAFQSKDLTRFFFFFFFEGLFLSLVFVEKLHDIKIFVASMLLQLIGNNNLLLRLLSERVHVVH